MKEPSAQQYVIPVQVRSDQSDEVSLVDVFLILRSHKLLIIATTILGLLIAFGFSTTLTKKVTYSSPIEIGGTPPIETQATSLARLEESFIPTELNRSLPPFIVTARASGDDSFVVLETTTDPDNAALVEQIHKKVAQKLATYHNTIIDELRTRLESQVKELQAHRDSPTRNEFIESLRKQTDSMQAQINSGSKLSSDEMQTLVTNLKVLQTQLSQELFNQQRTSLEIDAKINELGDKILAHKPSRLINTAIATKQSNPKIEMVIAFGGVAGLVFGTMFALLLNFLRKIPSKTQQAVQ